MPTQFTDPTGIARRTFLLLLLAVAAMALSNAGLAQDDRDIENEGFYQSYVFGKPDQPSETWKIAYGGRLFDTWWAVLLDEPPAGTHPAYPADGAEAGPSSWRCVTCHAWDYHGAGVGLAGDLAPSRGADPAAIVRLLRAPLHGFTADLIPDPAAEAIALFVSKGQVAAEQVIDPTSGRFRGDPERGREIFQNVCAICHDFDGRAWIEGDDEIGATLGALAKSAPRRVLHKVLNGQTYADMPAMRVFGLTTVLDVLSYVQTLPEE